MFVKKYIYFFFYYFESGGKNSILMLQKLINFIPKQKERPPASQKKKKNKDTKTLDIMPLSGLLDHQKLRGTLFEGGIYETNFSIFFIFS